jgi:hypothetical protein
VRKLRKGQKKKNESLFLGHEGLRRERKEETIKGVNLQTQNRCDMSPADNEISFYCDRVEESGGVRVFPRIGPQQMGILRRGGFSEG